MNIKNYFMYAIAAVMMTGCSKEFLETEPTEFVSATQIAKYSEKNPELQAANISGIYSLMYQTGTGGTDNHDDFGQKGYDIYSDMLSSDMVLAGLTYGWYSGISQMTVTQDFTSNGAYQPWRYYYRIAFSANTVIQGLGGNDAIPETDEGKYFMGQAKALRAYSYYYLAQFYAKGYNPSEPILPIYRDNDTPAQPLSTTQEVYDFIVSDLTDAVTLLDGYTRTGKQEINKYVAEGLLAYTYAAMGNYEEVATLTEDVITNGGFTLMSAEEVLGGFNDVNTSGWMWGVNLTTDQGLDLISWWGQVDLFTYSYAWAGDPKTIDINLYNSISEDDVRKGQFIDEDGDGRLYPTGKFYDPNKVIGGQRVVTTDYVYMRVAEMYLLHAEAAAMTGDEAGAKQALIDVLSKRLDDVSYIDALGGGDLMDEIYLQTRIEFWGEGKSYLAMKRLKATITRGSNHLSFAGESFQYNDPKLTFPIPQSEIQNNPNIN